LNGVDYDKKWIQIHDEQWLLDHSDNNLWKDDKVDKDNPKKGKVGFAIT